MASTIAKRPQDVNILNLTLDRPNLSATIKSLDAGLLTRLIRHVGLEDSGSIVSQATAAQLKAVFDEELWRCEVPGRTEAFDADRFGLWIEIMMENGPAFTAETLLEMDEELLILGICRLVRVVNRHAVNMGPGEGWQLHDGGYPESEAGALLNRLVADYRVISKDDTYWDALLKLLLHMDETEGDTLTRLLDRCSRISEECNDYHGSVLKRITGEEMLEEEVAAERENRKEARGFVMPSSAAFFLCQARSASLKRIVLERSMPHVARIYTESAETRSTYTEKSRVPGNETERHPGKETADLIDALQKAEVTQFSSQQKLEYDGQHIDDSHLPLVSVMRIIMESDPDLYARRTTELSFLSNTLISGCGYRGRRFLPNEAVEAALSVCNLGSEHLLHSNAAPEKSLRDNETIMAILRANDLVRMFRIGWKTLFECVILTTANGVLTFLNRLKDNASDQEQIKEIAGLVLVLRAGISSGRPWIFQEEIDYLQVFLDGETTGTLGGLIQEYPTFSKAICRTGGLRPSPFIWSHAHIRTLQCFLEDIFDHCEDRNPVRKE